jgi:hypothetical protein
MSFSRRGSRGSASDDDAQVGGRAPGKRSRAEKRFGWTTTEPKTSVQRQERATGTAPGSSQQGNEIAATSASEGENVQERAAAGVASGSGGALPYRDQIQASFGRHDIGQVEAHVGGEAARAAADIGAQAFATGNKVAFADQPDLHTAAHEAAHVVQQRGGVQLKGGVGRAGDRYEQHADAVADHVVAGRSAEGVLDQMAGATSTSGRHAAPTVQRKPPPGSSSAPEQADAPASTASSPGVTSETSANGAGVAGQPPPAGAAADPFGLPPVLQSSDPAVDGRPVHDVGADLKVRAKRAARLSPMLRDYAIRTEKDERDILRDHDGLLAGFVNLFNDADKPNPARWQKLAADWEVVTSYLATVDRTVPAAETINRMGQTTEQGLRLWETTWARSSRATDELLKYLEGFSQATAKVHAGVELTGDIALAGAVACAVVLTGPAILAAGGYLAGAAGATGVAAKVVVGGTAVVGAGTVGAATEGGIKASGQTIVETAELIGDLAAEGKTWEQAAARFDWGAIAEQGWEGAQRGFVDGVLAYAGMGLERVLARGAAAGMSKLFGPAGKGMFASMLRKATEQAAASGLSGGIAGALDAGARAILDGKSVDEVLAAIRAGFAIGGVAGTLMGAGAGAVGGRRVAVEARQLDELAALLRTDPDAFAMRYNQLVAEMSPEQLIGFHRELSGRRFVDAEHYGPARQAFEAGETATPPEHRYGEAEFDDWRQAAQFMEERARTGQPLTRADIQEAHRLAARNVSAEAGTIRTTGAGNTPLVGAGGVGVQGVWTALSPEQVRILESNPHLRLVWRRVMDPALTPQQVAAGFETAVIAYPDADTVVARLDEFFAWCGTNRDVMPPVEFAAAAQRHLVSIHPFADGNGRLSRLVMDHALQSRGLPPALLRDPNVDYMVSPEAWTDEVRRGVLESYRTAARHIGLFNAGLREADPRRIIASWAAVLSLGSSPERVVQLLYGESGEQGMEGEP